MVKEKPPPSPLPFVLRRRDNITANEKTPVTVKSASLSSTDDEEDESYKPEVVTKPIPQPDSARVTRRTTRNSKDEFGHTSRVETDENGQSQAVDEEEHPASTEDDSCSSDPENPSDDFEDVEGNSEGGIRIRRSSRRKVLRYGTYHETQITQFSNSASWMLGGGPEAKGYPRRTASLVEHRDHRRRSSRVVGAKPNYATSDGQGVEGNDSEDMYSRVKKRRTSFNGAVTQVTPDDDHRRNRGHSIPNEEPVAKRLRDRATLSLRQNGYGPAKSSRIEMLLRKKMKKRRRQTRSSSSSSSSSSDSDDEKKSPSKKRPRKRFHLGGGGQSFHIGQHSKKERMMLMEAQPIAVDPNINFQCVGGLDQFIGKLKEIVLFPLMYSEFYSETKMRPPRGILLHGPPGTGKTLLARALANECSNINGKKVSFFLRKGADLLNKWIGESERQLRVLFQQAAQHQPSIIFFDEIDGLAPVRSSKSDQVHNSIVSTLLAELDGLQDRGQVIVIGSTNRLDFVDPALRRPGRFDCELPIFLPTRDGRRDILKVFVADWKDPVSDETLDHLADRCIGFSGADLKLLCWTTCMNSLRRTYPQIYTSNQKYLLDYGSIKRESEDWDLALKTVSPSTNRSIFSKYSPAQPLPLFVLPLLRDVFNKAALGLENVFPWKSLSVIGENSTKRLLLTSDRESGVDEFIVPALLHSMETLPVYVLSSESLFMDNFAAECSVTQICMEAAKHSGPCIMYIPNVDRLCMLLSDSAKEILIRMITQSLRKPILILATMNTKISASVNKEDEFWKLFIGSFLHLESPSTVSRLLFFEPVFKQASVVKISKDANRVLETLPLAPPESPQKKTLTEEELRAIEKRETAVLRELRIFLREVLLKLARNKKFAEFTKPVDHTEVPDYLEVITNPMDLETMMYKLNVGGYMSAGQFLEDVQLIASNCLQYNPHKDESDKRLRMRAHELLDFANTLIEKEMDSDYEEQCKEVIKAREERKSAARKTENERRNSRNSTSTEAQEPASSTSSAVQATTSTAYRTPENNNSQQSQASSITTSGGGKRRRKSAWSRGGLPPKHKKPVRKVSDVSILKSPVPEAEEADIDSERKRLKVERVTRNSPAGSSSSITFESSQSSQEIEVFDITDESQSQLTTSVSPAAASVDRFVACKNPDKYKEVFEELLNETVKMSKEHTVVGLLNLRFNLLRLVDKHQFKEDKKELSDEIKGLIMPSKPKITGSVKIPLRSPRL